MKEQGEKKTGGTEPIPPELVARAMAGDQAAFTELYERTSAMLYRTIRSMVRDEDLVWDIQQDSYLRAWSGISELQAPEAFLPWLRRIAVNTATNALNKRAPLNFTDLSDLDDEEGWGAELPDLREDAQPELVLDRKETSRLVREILNKLPREQQLIVGMYYSEEMPIKDIAETLHVTPGTVKTQLHRGRKRIEAEVRALEQQGVKLYGLSPIPFLLALLRKLEPAPRTEKKVLAAVLAETAAAGSAAAAEGAAAAGTATATVTAMTATQAFLHGLGGKLLAVTILAALLASGTLIYNAAKKGALPRIGIERPPAEASAAETEPPAETEMPTEPAEPSKHPAPADAPENACGPDLTWSIDEDSGILTIEGSGDMYDYEFQGTPWNSWNETIQSVAFPEGLTSIGNYAFYECGSISTLAIPESVTSIGNYAFEHCGSLESITLPDGLLAIGEGSFAVCTRLLNVAIPKSLSSIGQGAFADCDNLSRFSVAPDNQFFSNDERGVLFNKTQTMLIAFPGGMTDSYEIPAGVTAICDDAFNDCTQLNSIVLPEGLISIGNNAFRLCSISSINLPKGLVSIGEEAFYGCDSLISVTLPASLAELGAGAFSACRELSAFEVDPANTAFSADERGVLYNLDKTALLACPTELSGKYDISTGVTAIASHAFDCCANLMEITIPADVRVIGESAFAGCISLRSIDLPSGLTSIGHNAFEACIALTSIVLPEGLQSIEDEVFCDCVRLRSVTIPASVTSIGDDAFAGCASLTSVTIPASVISIGAYAFEGCVSLTSVAIPESVTSIGDGTFSGCASLTSVTIPTSVTSIGDGAFFGCESLESFSVLPESEYFSADDNGVLYNKEYTALIAFPGGKGGAYTIPSSVTSIETRAFSDCDKLTSVTIPTSVTSIGDGAFFGCERLESFSVFPESEYFSVDDNGVLYNKEYTALIAFPGGKGGAYTIPSSVTSIGTRVFRDCDKLTSVTIPEGATSIGDMAFYDCGRLTSVTIPETVTSIGNDAFSDCPNLTIHGVAGSEAERYAAENEIPFEALS